MKWNVTLYGLLFSGLGAFSYLLLANYSDLSPHVADMLFSKGAFIFFITAFKFGILLLHCGLYLFQSVLFFLQKEGSSPVSFQHVQGQERCRYNRQQETVIFTDD